MNNILVQYQGGGWDGCIWEWNFFFLDADGKFHDIFSSGCGGITTQEQADELVINQSGHVYFYDVTDPAAWREFSKECNAGLVTGVVAWFDEQEFETPEAATYCHYCGELALDPVYNPDCGVGEIFCQDCYSTGMCDCGSWSEDIQEYGDDEYLCPDCREYRDKEKLREQQHDLYWASMTTGIPDLFSEEMNWYWDRR
jgi:hypothetical protein